MVALMKPNQKNFPREYAAWAGMKVRCYNSGDKSYKWYGARGIRVCDRWRKSFANFLSDVGPKPSDKHSIDRYPDNDGDYKPSNCRWATKSQQEFNKRKGLRSFPSARLAAIFLKMPPDVIADHLGIDEDDVLSWKIMPSSYRDQVLMLIGEMPDDGSHPKVRRPKIISQRPTPKFEPGTNRAGYEAVLAHFQLDGRRHGSKQRLATALNLTSRAVVDRWQRYGIPMKYAPVLKKLTGMDAPEIWPENYC